MGGSRLLGKLSGVVLAAAVWNLWVGELLVGCELAKVYCGRWPYQSREGVADESIEPGILGNCVCTFGVPTVKSSCCVTPGTDCQ